MTRLQLRKSPRLLSQIAGSSPFFSTHWECEMLTVKQEPIRNAARTKGRKAPSRRQPARRHGRADRHRRDRGRATYLRIRGKNAAAVALGRMGGKARAEGMSAKRRKEIAKKAAKSRWAK